VPRVELSIHAEKLAHGRGILTNMQRPGLVYNFLLALSHPLLF
jgi:hypothetical protein